MLVYELIDVQVTVPILPGVLCHVIYSRYAWLQEELTVALWLYGEPLYLLMHALKLTWVVSIVSPSCSSRLLSTEKSENECLWDVGDSLLSKKHRRVWGTKQEEEIQRIVSSVPASQSSEEGIWKEIIIISPNQLVFFPVFPKSSYLTVHARTPSREDTNFDYQALWVGNACIRP